MSDHSTKHGVINNTNVSPYTPTVKKFAILVDEIGSVGRCLTYPAMPGDIDECLLRVAVAALHWYESRKTE